MVNTNINDINDLDEESTFNTDDDYLYDNSRENTGTDLFTLNYKHIDVNINDRKSYHIYDNYFDHVDEPNIMEKVIHYLAINDITDVFNLRCVDTYSRNSVDDFMIFNSKKKDFYARNTLKRKYNQMIFQETRLNISYFRDIYFKFNISMIAYFKKNKGSIKIYADSCKLYDDIIKNHIIKFKKKNTHNKKLIKRNRLSMNKNKWINFTTYLLMKSLINF